MSLQSALNLLQYIFCYKKRSIHFSFIFTFYSTLHLYLGHLADAFIQSNLQYVHLSELNCLRFNVFSSWHFSFHVLYFPLFPGLSSCFLPSPLLRFIPPCLHLSSAPRLSVLLVACRGRHSSFDFIAVNPDVTKNWIVRETLINEKREGQGSSQQPQ